MKIAIVHEMLIKLGGAEKVLQELMQMYPEADVYTLMYDEKKVGTVFPKNRIRCNTPAQVMFTMTGKPRLSLPLMPASVKKIDLAEYDLVISSSSGFAHGVFTIGNTRHICYCHSPARYLWDWTENIQRELWVIKAESIEQKAEKRNIISFIKQNWGWPMVNGLFDRLRAWDIEAAKRPDVYIANSHEVQARIQKYYQRDSVVIWPPVQTEMFNVQCTMYNGGLLNNSESSPSPVRRELGWGSQENRSEAVEWNMWGSRVLPVSQREFYIITSALTPFKRLDIPIRVLSRLSIPLKIIGSGDQRAELEKLAWPTVEFLWRLSDEEIVENYRHARGFLMPQKEDAGITPIEAMAAGLPVFGQGAGGLLESSIDGVTGRFFPEETDESFEKAFLTFDQEVSSGKYDNPAPLIEQAEKFNTAHFREAFQEVVKRYI